MVLSPALLLISTLLPQTFSSSRVPTCPFPSALPQYLSQYSLHLSQSQEGRVPSGLGHKVFFSVGRIGNQAPVKLLLFTNVCFFWTLTIKYKLLSGVHTHTYEWLYNWLSWKKWLKTYEILSHKHLQCCSQKFLFIRTERKKETAFEMLYENCV